MNNNIFLPIAILLSAVFLSGAILFSDNTEPAAQGGAMMSLEEFDEILEGYAERKEARELGTDAVKSVLTIQENDRVNGDRNADITIFEYSDFECPYCKKFYTATNQAVAEYAGKVNVVYRHFPGLHQPLSFVEANAAECAGELGGDKMFFAYHDTIYQNTQSNGRSIEKVEGRGLDVSVLDTIAADLGLDAVAFSQCLASMKYQGKIDENSQSGQSIGVTGTPNAFILNNKTGEIKKIGGYVPYSFLKGKIDEIL